MRILNFKNGVVLALSLFLGMVAWKSNANQTYDAVFPVASDDACKFDPKWMTNPSLPTKIPVDPGQTESSFCNFYQFSWQAFLYLMSPDGEFKIDQSNNNSYPITFENQTKFPLLPTGSTNPCTVSNAHPKRALFLRTTKSSDPLAPMTEVDLPERIGQAGGGSVIYDQNGNTAFYEVRFSRDMCDIRNILSRQYFPAGTTELKMAWKVLSITKDGQTKQFDSEKDFYTIAATIDGVEGDYTLGLIGFHIAISTETNPEMVWVSFEHSRNNPLCSGNKTNINWSFTSRACAKEPSTACDFNHPTVKAGTDTPVEGGKPTNICQVYENGTLPGQNQEQRNNDFVTSLNQQFEDLGKRNPNRYTWERLWMDNYRMIGAIWLNQPNDSSQFNSSDDNIQPPTNNPTFFGEQQRGSIALANPVMETDFQNYRPGKKDSGEPYQLKNCFSCHNFYPEGQKKPASDGFVEVTNSKNILSHILDNIERQNNWCTLTTDGKPATVYSKSPIHLSTLDDPRALYFECSTACSEHSQTKGLNWNGNYKSNGTYLNCQCC